MTGAPKDPTFGPAWQGWESYRQFADSVKSKQRFVRSASADDFLSVVRDTCRSREEVISADKIFWRARLGSDTREVEHEDGDITVKYEEDVPFSALDMKPIPNWQGEGRAHPRGIPCLYLGTTRETVMAEVRPWIGATISVSRFKLNRDVRVILCSKYHDRNSVLKVFGSGLTREEGIWIAIDQAFATPVSRDDEARQYIPTQIIAELFKSAGYDGIVYKSLLIKDGFNLALFDLDAATAVDGQLYSANSINPEFSETGAVTWFAK